MLSPLQYRLCSNHSTELAALNLVDELTYKLDSDTISKLEHYGVN